jgi:hypothetical protein
MVEEIGIVLLPDDVTNIMAIELSQELAYLAVDPPLLLTRQEPEPAFPHLSLFQVRIDAERVTTLANGLRRLARGRGAFEVRLEKVQANGRFVFWLARLDLHLEALHRAVVEIAAPMRAADCPHIKPFSDEERRVWARVGHRNALSCYRPHIALSFLRPDADVPDLQRGRVHPQHFEARSVALVHLGPFATAVELIETFPLV